MQNADDRDVPKINIYGHLIYPSTHAILRPDDALSLGNKHTIGFLFQLKIPQFCFSQRRHQAHMISPSQIHIYAMFNLAPCSLLIS